jgi:hypothetical protein
MAVTLSFYALSYRTINITQAKRVFCVKQNTLHYLKIRRAAASPRSPRETCVELTSRR